PVSVLDPAAARCGAGRGESDGVAFGVPGSAVGPAPAHGLLSRLRRAHVHRPAGREPLRGRAARASVSPALPDRLPDPPHERRRRVRPGAGPPRRRRRQRLVRMQAGGALAMRRRTRHGLVVRARLRRGCRSEPAREPLRGLRPEPRSRDQALLRPLAPQARDGHDCGRPRLSLDRLGLGRKLERLDEGLHALLGLRALVSAPAMPAPLPVPRSGFAYAPAVATGCFISTGRSLEEAIERVKLAESLGYESVYVTHIAGRESLTVITAYALATSRIRVGTGVVPIYTRTPATMAQTAATIDELSGGRVTLGLGVSHR